MRKIGKTVLLTLKSVATHRIVLFSVIVHHCSVVIEVFALAELKGVSLFSLTTLFLGVST